MSVVVVRAAAGDEWDAVAAWAQRVGTLLAAGLEPLAAVRAVEHPALGAEAANVESAYEVPDRLLAAAQRAPDSTGRAWALLAAYWVVAIESGAPLAAALDRVADSLRALADADRQIDLAIAGPISTARIVALLPLLGLGMGLLIGANPLAVLFGTVPGAVAGAGGAALLFAGARWNRRLVAAARRYDPLAGSGSELLALALASGGTPERASALVAATADRCGLAVALADAHETLAFAKRSGIPVAALLRADAARLRRVALAAVLRQAALLGSRLLAPLGLCFLPAFVLWGVVPLVIGILRGVLASF
ncbi:type II secretion system F family protein [Protaetiibacter larvae]|uniref:type II secretion system F family protein n=1 Tax=Protaetiibacter larvae TaxID=2592654 RepID=UPI00143E083F|nr:type II secretion system F family protein [Protaetiibacter larvae]